MNSTVLHPVIRALREIPLQDAPTETWITRRLAVSLPDGESEVPFPGTRERCDVQFGTGDGSRTWLELKYAQPYFSQSQPFKDNRANFRKVLLGTAVHDVRVKLPYLQQCDPNAAVGFALVLYYHASGTFGLPTGCIDEFRVEAGLRDNGWREYQLGPWNNPNLDSPKCLIEVYYWEKGSALRMQGSFSSPRTCPTN